MATRDDILQQAMALPPEDRAYMADALEQSLSAGDFSTPQIAKAWADEIERRVAAYDNGEIQSIDADIALADIRKRLADHRASRGGS